MPVLGEGRGAVGSRGDTGHGPPHAAEKARLGEVLPLARGPRVLSPPSAPPGSSNPGSFLKGKNKVRRVKTIYDCQADNDDELTFVEGEVIVVTGEEDQEWWVRTRLPRPRSQQPLPRGRPSLRHALENHCAASKPGQESQRVACLLTLVHHDL